MLGAELKPEKDKMHGAEIKSEKTVEAYISEINSVKAWLAALPKKKI